MKSPEADNKAYHIMPELAMPKYCDYDQRDQCDQRDHKGMRVWLSEPLDLSGFMYTIAQLHISSTGDMPRRSWRNWRT